MSTPFDGQPGRLRLRVGNRAAVDLSIPEGPTSHVQATFDVSRAGVRDIALQFLNDRLENGRDRNLSISRVRISRTDPIPHARREKVLQGSLDRANVVLISIDTLRRDHLSLYGYDRETSPNLDALAARGITFERAVSASHWTAPAHASLLSGLHPDEHGLVQYPEPGALHEDVPMLAERLVEAGYQTAAFVGGSYVSEKLGLGQGFEYWHEERTRAERRFEQAADWLDSRDPTRPFFLFVHTYEVHEPYDPPSPHDQHWQTGDPPEADVDLRGQISKLYNKGFRPTSEQLRHLEALYDGEIRYTDAQLGLFLERLGVSGLDEETLVVVTSDHGEQFMDHGGLAHGALYGELIGVPLVLSHPVLDLWGVPRVEQVTPAIDLVPTLLDLLDIRLPSGEVSGQSRLAALAGHLDPSIQALSTSEMLMAARSSVLDLAG
ncbi:MAG: sulfatase, partial [Myxococcota bacterium]|nr:sulfatase [Myxococcota bacterium]